MADAKQPVKRRGVQPGTKRGPYKKTGVARPRTKQRSDKGKPRGKYNTNNILDRIRSGELDLVRDRDEILRLLGMPVIPIAPPLPKIDFEHGTNKGIVA